MIITEREFIIENTSGFVQILRAFAPQEKFSLEPRRLFLAGNLTDSERKVGSSLKLFDKCGILLVRSTEFT
uniref:Uncharacterized protein n=1 Tax=Arion vulgaris TaxID=1028688 RepID=A0A0B6XTH5_9EUPU